MMNELKLREEWREHWQTRRGPNGLSDFEKEWQESNGPEIIEWWIAKMREERTALADRICLFDDEQKKMDDDYTKGWNALRDIVLKLLENHE